MIRRIAVWGAAFVTLAFVVILTNQVLQLSQFAATVHPTLGEAVFWLLLLVLAGGIAVPIVLIVRLPAALVAPTDDSGPEFEAHLERLRKRLSANEMIRGRPLESREEVESALTVLDDVARERIQGAGRRAFLTTAISQNGALDAVVVFGIQARLVWDIATVYSQRPGWREMTYLYSNVLTTAFIAGELEDAEIAEAMEPAISAVLGSAGGLVPGLQVASNIFVSSVLSGTANAFMTLRVGIIAQEYSRAWTKPRRGAVRGLAVTRAGSMLGAIVMAGAAKVSTAIGRGAGKAVTGAVSGTGRAVSGALSSTGRRISDTGSAIRERFRGAEDVAEAADDADEEGADPPGSSTS